MPRNPTPPLPPETRLLVTYDEGAQWWSHHYRPISARSLRRIPLETKLQGRNRLVVFTSLKAAADREFNAAPTVLFAHADAQTAKAKPKLKAID
jgi:hypothetical protein